jgi:hypothetical protein
MRSGESLNFPVIIRNVFQLIGAFKEWSAMEVSVFIHLVRSKHEVVGLQIGENPMASIATTLSTVA